MTAASRANIAAALNAMAPIVVAGSDTPVKLVGHEKRPTVALKVGFAWSLLAGQTPGPATMRENRWRVVVFLGQNETRAEALYDAMWDPIRDALKPLAYMDSSSAFAYQTEGGEAFAAEYNLRSE